jgi:hypothetical protein
MKILLGDVNAKLEREDIFNLTIGNSNDNSVRIVNFATSKYLIIKSTIFQLRNIHKYTWTSPDQKTHNQTDHISIGGRWHLSIFDILCIRGANCDTNHCLVYEKVRERLVVAKCRESLAVSKQAAQKFDVERFDFRKSGGLEVRRQYQTKISKKLAALENLNYSKEINRAWENLEENIKTIAK